MTPQTTILRQVELHGPAFPGLSWHSFWSIKLGSPFFGLPNVRPERTGLQEDRTHPVRAIALDLNLVDENQQIDGRQLPLRKPRLVSEHVIGGLASGVYADTENLTFKTLIDKPKGEEVTSFKGSGFRTEEIAGPQTGRARFHHVVATPLLPDGDWPVKHQDVVLPSCRLLQGAIPLLAVREELKWLQGIRLKTYPPLQGDKKERVRLVLVADGIELEAFAPFPKPDGSIEDLPGRFLLAPVGPGRFVLRLLPSELDSADAARWKDRWLQLAPTNDMAAQRLTGLKIEFNRGDLPPAFAWEVTVAPGKITGLNTAVAVPEREIIVRLLGPQETGVVQGETLVKPASWSISPKLNAGALETSALQTASEAVWKAPHADWGQISADVAKWDGAPILTAVVLPARPKQLEGGPALELLVPPDTALRLDVSDLNAPLSARLIGRKGKTAAHALAHDEVRLAAALRSVHGLPESGVGQRDPKRPLLSAFIPLDDGWLQMPVPNLPLPDPAKDSEIIASPVPAMPNVLTGFLRYGEREAAPKVLSAFNSEAEKFSVTRAPWVVTVEGTQGLAFAAALHREGPRRAAAVLLGPELSTRGLLWISSDRPDLLEALPRIGAGPGAYLDVPLESFDVERPAAVPVILRELAFTMAKEPDQPDLPERVKRSALQFAIGFNPASAEWQRCFKDPAVSDKWRELIKEYFHVITGGDPPKLPSDAVAATPPVLWMRHPAMPLAALMPMTRSAAAAVRPLESRDLFPMAVKQASPGEPLVLIWQSSTSTTDSPVFPTVTSAAGEDLSVLPVVAWPWPSNATDDRFGIALAAFGVPGAEVIFSNPGALSPRDLWGKLQYALRFDLPALDEAFATATLPPVPEVLTPDSTDAPPPPAPPATALDWVELHALWIFQEQRHHLARVMHSHLDAYGKMEAAKDHDVRGLVGGAIWKTSLNFVPGSPAEKLPYGTATVGGGDVSGNSALLGFNGEVTVKWEKRIDSATSRTTILGYAPPTLQDGANGEFLVDARGTGLGVIQDTPLWRRAVRARSGAGTAATLSSFDIVTTRTPIAVFAGAQPALFFWFKDLPVGSAGLLSPPAGIDPAAWQDGHLPGAGCEWRLWVNEEDLSEDVFRRGRERIPFFGFGLEPLRLLACEPEADGTITKATVLCRLHLGPRIGGPEAASNLVELGLVWSAPLTALVIDRLDPVKFGTPEEPLPLRFAFRAHERPLGGASGVERAIQLNTLCRWPSGGDRPEFFDSTLKVSFLGDEITLEDAMMEVPGGTTDAVIIRWNGSPPPKPPKTLIAGEGKFGVEAITITVATETVATIDPPTIDFARWIAILPSSEDEEAVTAAPPALLAHIVKETGQLAVSLFGQPLSFTTSAFDEEAGAVALTLTVDQPFSPLPGYAPTGTLSLGLIARVDANEFVAFTKKNGGRESSGVAPLSAGYLAGRWIQTQAPGAPDSIRLDAACKQRVDAGDPDSRWTGALTLRLTLALTSAIRWPALNQALGSIPSPEGPAPRSGRENLTFHTTPNSGYRHGVTYVVDGQQLPFATASRIVQATDTKTFFAVPVTAVHELTPLDDHNNARWSFTGVETVAFGRAEALIPRPVEGEPPAISKPDPRTFAKDPVTFGARYRDLVKNGVDSGVRAPGMAETGIGHISTILAGALGHAFRAAFWEAPSAAGNPLSIIGGFVGLVDLTGAQPPQEHRLAPLVRLPFLNLLGGTLQVGQRDEHAEVPWVDGTAALDIATAFRPAIAPASASWNALRSALLAGGILAGGPAGTALRAAILVEQSYRVSMDRPAKGDLTQTIFFPAAAVSVARLLSSPPDPKLPPTVLSLLAGRTNMLRPSTLAQAGEQQAFAACLLTRSAASPADYTELRALPAEEAGSVLATLGEDLLLESWRGPAAAGVAEVPRALVIARAFAAHAQPRAAILAIVRDDGKVGFFHIDLPAPRVRTTFREPMRRSGFADPARGYGLAPGGQPEGWLRGVEEGITSPFRDSPNTLPAKITASGLSGLSRRVSLPAQAGGVRIWVAEARVPIYHSAGDLAGLAAPPIAWLAPGQTRPRLPCEDSIVEAVTQLFGTPNTAVQWIVPAGGTVASVGDRAGIVFARTIRLEAAIDAFPGFDHMQSRFGRPAQGGTWSVRTERTPRPGPLPVNTRDALRDRRPCASRLEFGRPLEALRGPADTIAGEANREGKFGPWVIKIVAAAKWNGMISDSFDGTVQLDVEIDIVNGSAHIDQKHPGRVLRYLLMPAVAGTQEPDEKLLNIASLVIGDLIIPFRQVFFLAESTSPFKPITGPGVVEGSHRGSVRLVLDPRLDGHDASVGAARADLAFALRSNLSLPPVEVRLTVHPNSNPEIPDGAETISQAIFGLSQLDAASPVLPHGDSRPPVTLRIPLMPVVSSRGALPLPPNSILFMDPAYDADLGSAPVRMRNRVERPRFSAPLPTSRGNLQATLYADRGRVNRGGSIVFMIDLAFERPLEGAAAIALALDNGSDGGDLIKPDPGEKPWSFVLALAVTTRTGERRNLQLGAPGGTPSAAPAPIQFGQVYELPLGLLLEMDRSPARLAAGDMLELTVAERTKLVLVGNRQVPKLDLVERVQADIWDSENSRIVRITGLDTQSVIDDDLPLIRILRVLLTDEPIVEPPPALYAALVRRDLSATDHRLSLPLYAQSPLPWRVLLRDAKADFRVGYLRRAATFIWNLARPLPELDQTSIHIVKVERNGQTFLPPDTDIPASFVTARRIDLEPN